MDDDDISVLKKLDSIVKLELSNLFHGTGEMRGQICTVCSEINRVLDSFRNNASVVDVSDAFVANFLKSTLPILVEVFLRRSTLRCVLLLLHIEKFLKRIA